MKRIGFVFLFCINIAVVFSQSNADKVKELLSGVLKFDNVSLNVDRPIADINLIAMQQADTMLVLKKTNVSEVLSMAKKYQYCLITVERHTIVLVESWTNCIQSGSWGVCMPYGSGYIQKGELSKKVDHINNIIGIPDSQRRTVFLFNKK